MRGVSQVKIERAEHSFMNIIKNKYKHISGIPEPVHFCSSEERMANWKTTQTIEKKIVKPATRLINAQASAEKLMEYHLNNRKFIEKFRGK